MSDPKSKIKPYHHAAGGWGALKTSLGIARAQTGIIHGMKTLLRVNQPDGFDCPGCAWPDPKDAHTFEFCENGVKAVTWEATQQRTDADFFAKHTVAELSTWSDHDLEAQGRLTEPMRYNKQTDRYEPITWQRAFEVVANALRAMDNPNRGVFYTSGRASNEAAFLYQLFVRKLGTNNLPDCSNMCHESSGVALSQTIGVGKGTVTLDDFEKTDCVLVIGQNPGTNHPRMLAVLQAAAKRGCKIITLNPLKERGLIDFIHPQHAVPMLTGKATKISTRYLQVNVGGDLAAIKGICKHIVEQDAIDRDFISEHTQGYEAFANDLAQTTWEQIEQQSGLTRGELQHVAEDYINAEASIACWAMGLTQHKHAVPTIQMVVNLLLLRGNLGKPGAGACPVRGHSNVQGDRTMGIYEKPKPQFLDALQNVFGFDPPREHGYDTVATIHAMARGDVDVFVSLGGNFAAATPDSALTHDAMRKCKLNVQISTKLNRSHTVVGDDALILPCLGRTEKDISEAGAQRVTVEDSMSMVHASVGRNEPAATTLKSEPAIIAGIARATLTADDIDWQTLGQDYDRIRDKIEAVMPEMFGDYNERINEPGGFYLGNTAADRNWQTETRKANFTTHAIPDLALPQGQLKLMTMRSHDQYNTTVYDLNDRYRGVFGTREVLFVHHDTLRELELNDGDIVSIQSHYADGDEREVHGFRVVAFDVPRGCAAGYFPELNPLVSVNSVADESHTPTSKFIPVTLSRAKR